MAQRSSTHHEWMGEGHFVTIQHCERVVVGPTETHICNKYLGYNYPSIYCEEHQS